MNEAHNLFPSSVVPDLAVLSRPERCTKMLTHFPGQTTALTVLLLSLSAASGEIKVVVEHNEPAAAIPSFRFKSVPAPSRTDAATSAEFTLLEGSPDGNAGPLAALHDGLLPTGEDSPAENFFFNAGTKGGSLLVDLRGLIQIKQINTYSWHPGSRAPQVYALFASDGRAKNFDPRAPGRAGREKAGWELIAKVDTRGPDTSIGGQYGVSISDSSGNLGTYRYLLFEISRTEGDDPFGNTFYSEIDVVDQNSRLASEPAGTRPRAGRTFLSRDGKYEIVIDPGNAPDLSEWAFKELAPVVQEWYPRIISLLPEKDFQPPTRIIIDFGKNTSGYVAITRRNHITCASGWFRENLQGEAKGCVVHELVHVVQHYRSGRPAPPGWLVEGIPDYLRWYLYEPQAHGADISGARAATVRFDSGYRPTANFLDWVTRTYDKKLVLHLNTALRNGTYHEGLWKERTGHRLAELNEEWKAQLTARGNAGTRND